LSGRTSAYDQLVRQWSGRVLAVCHARVRRPDVAEDMAQEALYRGYKALGTLADAEKFGPWLLGIATRVCLDWLKASQRKTVPLSSLQEDWADGMADQREPAADADLVHDERLSALMNEVNRLPARHREALLLYYYEEHTYQELARMLGTSVPTINARLTQARQMLRRAMEAREKAETQ
jgi:RNA polymerase sigma-70 factor (ECF subfamily)